MRWLAVVLALSVTALGDPGVTGRFDRTNRRCAGGRSTRGFTCDDLAFFEFAPAPGVGMGAACACANVTGAKGEAVTWVRASNGTCTRPGLATTGIANGDLVVCGSNVPRVERAPDGTLALLDEVTRLNSLLRSQRLDNAAWVNFIGTGGTNPVVTADQGTAPDPSPISQPEQVVFAATTGAQASMLAQAALSVAAYSAGVYAQYVSGTCNLDLCIETNATGPVATCTSTSVSSSTTWTRLIDQNVTSVASGRVFIGNGSAVNGGSARSACTVLLWQADGQAGAYLTSPIYTDAATATRAAEAGTYDMGASAPSGNLMSMAFTIATEWTGAEPTEPFVVPLVANHLSFADNTAGTGLNSAGTGGTSWKAYSANTVPTLFSTSTTALSITASAPSRGFLYVDGTNVNGSLGGTSFTASGAISGSWSPARYLQIGGPNAGGNAVGGLLYGICVDPSPTRCR